MKRHLPLLGFLAVTLLLAGCDSNKVVQPGSVSDADLRATAERVEGRLPNGLMPGGYYSLAWRDANAAYSDFELISTKTGTGTPIWTLSGEDSWIDTATPLGIAFDVDGSVYTIMNYMNFDRNACKSRLASIDPRTGVVTYIGADVPLNHCGPDIDSKGGLCVMGMEVPHLGYIFGTGKLYKVDKLTGVFTEIGPANVQYTDWMDLAFDSQDRLWATTQNKLFRLDPASGDILSVIPIIGVPGDPPPAGYTQMQEVMSIAFDDKDVLYGTAMNVEWDTGRGSPVMRIDTGTGQATLLGYTGQIYNHGGDMLPTRVKVLHRTGNGGHVLLEVSMNALAAHLAHGDVVPGTAGVPWPEGEPVAGRAPGR